MRTLLLAKGPVRGPCTPERAGRDPVGSEARAFFRGTFQNAVFERNKHSDRLPGRLYTGF